MLVQLRSMNEQELTLRRLPRAVIWDVDGTLIDSGALHFESWQEILRAEAYEMTHERFHATFGERNDTVLRTFLGPDLSANDIARISLAKEAHYRDLLRSRGIQPLPGVRRWLDALKSAGWKQAIASSAPLLNITAIVEALDLADYFDAVASGDDVHRGKPDPETFLLAARRLDVEPRRCVVIEDAPVGIEGARRAGMHSVGVLFAHASLAADIVTRSLEELSPTALEHLVPGPP
jgi:beta-phosphoglucomutase family hydrolase